MKLFEQRLISTGEVLDRFYSRENEPGKRVPAKHIHLWNDERYLRLEVGESIQFTGTTILVRIQ